MFLIEAYSNLGDTYEIANDFSNAINFHKKARSIFETFMMPNPIGPEISKYSNII